MDTLSRNGASRRFLLLIAGLLFGTSGAFSAQHVVENGDTLSKIAQKTLGDSSRWKEIASLNRLEPPYRIRVGQVLALPQEAGQSSGFIFAQEPGKASDQPYGEQPTHEGATPDFRQSLVFICIGTFFGATGWVATLIGTVMLYIAAFNQNVWWGLGCIMFFPLMIVFVVCHWAEAKKGFWASIAGTLLIGLVAVMGFWDLMSQLVSTYA